ncbi:MAG: polymer-forming cytoskeletal protein [Candidatus Acidiferrales bacterium]
MWTKTQPEAPGYAPASGQGSSPSSFNTNSNASANANAATRFSAPTAPSARGLSCLGSSIEVKGKISGEEDLQIDGKVEGAIALQGQRLTVGRTGHLNSEVHAREVVVYGKVQGNLRASDRVEIKKDGSVTGDITTSRISIEDGAYFKGRIEIDRAKGPSTDEYETVGASSSSSAN